MKTLTYKTTLLSFVAATVFGQGTILWNESVNGPLSEDFTQPAPLGMMLGGTNSIIGSSELVPPPPFLMYHPNFFTFEIPNGFAVQAINLQIDNVNVWVWVGNTGFSSDLAYTLNASNGDLLTQWGLAAIPSGSYGMYLENHNQQPITSVANFQLDFFVEAVPEPSAFLLLLVGLVFVGLRHLNKTRT